MRIACQPENVKTVGIVGTGTIGSGWAAHFLAQGLDVLATDPHPEAEQRLRANIDQAWPTLEKLGLASGANRNRLIFTSAIDDRWRNADFIQESTPENPALKKQIMLAIETAVDPNIIIASSTSGLMPSQLQAPCKNPERLVVGHPFNPVYLIPLVEVVGGQQTSPEAIDWSMAFYRHWGKEPLHCRHERAGHLANRLQETLSREMLHLIAEGIATTAELDAALTAGPGLRWGLMGTWMNYFLSNGDADTRLAFEHDIPVFFQSDNSRLVPPEFTEALIDDVANGIAEQTTGRSVKEIAFIRDEFLIGILKLRAEIKDKYGFESGRVINKAN